MNENIYIVFQNGKPGDRIRGVFPTEELAHQVCQERNTDPNDTSDGFYFEAWEVATTPTLQK